MFLKKWQTTFLEDGYENVNYTVFFFLVIILFLGGWHVLCISIKVESSKYLQQIVS